MLKPNPLAMAVALMLISGTGVLKADAIGITGYIQATGAGSYAAPASNDLTMVLTALGLVALGIVPLGGRGQGR
ncbi:MAG: hypothetical protein ABI693_17120 [Bryobacteraceae bacterium]